MDDHGYLNKPWRKSWLISGLNELLSRSFKNLSSVSFSTQSRCPFTWDWYPFSLLPVCCMLAAFTDLNMNRHETSINTWKNFDSFFSCAQIYLHLLVLPITAVGLFSVCPESSGRTRRFGKSWCRLLSKTPPRTNESLPSLALTFISSFSSASRLAFKNFWGILIIK